MKFIDFEWRDCIWASFIFLLGLIISIPGTGTKALWQDEIETAERARIILQTGWPLLKDIEGRWSLNTSGLEIEDSEFHRYSPWGQFYVGALGLKAFGPDSLFHLSNDQALRVPFAISHSMSSGILHLFFRTLGVSNPISALIAVAFTFNSTRLMHNRTARYHAVLDLLVAFGLYLVAAWCRNKKRQWYLWLLGLVFILLLQVHTLGGAVAATCLLAVFVFFQKDHHFEFEKSSVILFGWLLSAVILNIALTRPYISRGWGSFGYPTLRSFSQILWVGFPFVYTFGQARYFLEKKMRNRIFVFLIFEFLILFLLDSFSFSQSRYYLSLMLINFSLILVYLNFRRENYEKYSVDIGRVAISLLFGLCLQEFIVAPLVGIRGHWPLKGLYTVWDEAMSPVASPVLKQIFEFIPSEARLNVLVDYVPQYVNWYSRHNPALSPNEIQSNNFNFLQVKDTGGSSKIDFQIFDNIYNGNWNCSPHCGYHRTQLNLDGTYQLEWNFDGKTYRQKMCVVKKWETPRWLGAPFVSLQREQFNQVIQIYLGKACGEFFQIEAESK